MTDLIAHIREVIDEQAKRDTSDDGESSCSCVAKEFSDRSTHVAQAIVNRLGLRREAAENAKRVVGDKIRYVSALFDQELTTLEGAE
jgi:hypothetical protein